MLPQPVQHTLLALPGGRDPAQAADRVFGRFSFTYLIEILFRRKWVLIQSALLATLLAFGAALAIEKTYVTNETILVHKDEVLNPLVTWQTAVSLAIDDRLRTFEKIIYSRTLLEQLVERVQLAGAQPGQAEVDAQVAKLHGAIATQQSGSDSFQIQVTWDEPVAAQKICETATELFIAISLEGDRKQASTAVEFIEQQMEQYSAQLAGAEAALRRFKEENPDKLPTQHNSVLGDLRSYRTRLVEIDVRIKELTLKRQLFEQQLSGEKPMVVQTATYLSMTPYQSEYQQRLIEYQALLQQTRPDHPDALRLRANLDALKLLVDDEKNRGEAAQRQEVRSPIFDEVQAKLQATAVELEAAQLERREYSALAEELERTVVEIPANEAVLSALQREVDINKEVFETLRHKAEQARVNREIDLQGQANRFQILDRARVPLKHSKPNLPLMTAAGLIGGLFLGLCLAFAFEFLDPAIMREDELESVFSERVLAKVPKLHRSWL